MSQKIGIILNFYRFKFLHNALAKSNIVLMLSKAVQGRAIAYCNDAKKDRPRSVERPGVDVHGEQ